MDVLILTEEFRLGTYESAVVTLDPQAAYTGVVSVDGVMTDDEASDPAKAISHIILRALYAGQEDYVTIGSFGGWAGNTPAPGKAPGKPSFSSGFTPANPPEKLKAEIGYGADGVSVKCGFRMIVPTAA